MENSFKTGKITSILYQEGTKEIWTFSLNGDIGIWNQNHHFLQNFAIQKEPVKFSRSVTVYDRHNSPHELVLMITMASHTILVVDAMTLLCVVKQRISNDPITWAGCVQKGEIDQNAKQQLWVSTTTGDFYCLSPAYIINGFKSIYDDDTKYIGQVKGEDEKNGYGEYTNSKTNDIYLGFWSNGEVVFLSC